ncbi:MAG: hypothetical protein Q9217_002862 [Psora testacea]
MSSSFKKHSDLRPLRYRTPSPPRHAFEPISPILSGGSTTIDFLCDQMSIVTQKARYPWKRPLHEDSNSVLRDIQQSHRSNRSIDIFADIALATQSTSPSQQTNTPPGKSTINDSQEMTRPFKRARSEKLPSPELSRRPITAATRPATSFEQSLESRVMEAELLLNFSQRAREAFFSPTKQHAGNKQFQKACEQTLHIGQRLPLPGRPQHVFENAVQWSPLELHSPSPPPLSAAANKQVDIVAGNTISGLLDMAATQETNEPVKSSTALAPYKPMNGMAMDQDTQTGSVTGAQATAESKQAEFTPDVYPEDISIFETIEDKAMKDPATSGTEGVKDDARDLPNDERVEGEAGVEAQRATEVSSNAKPDFPADEPRTVHRPLGQAADEMVSDELVTAPNLEQSPPKTSNNPTECDTLSTSSPSTRSPIPTAVCTVCNFAQNSLSIDHENNATSWISCDGCRSWFHFACAGFKNEREVRSVDKYRCRKCKPIHGSTTYVRKSSRAHSAIDYAGLHQGVIKTSDDRPEHHYIQPIKDGTITFLPETFARMRPELVTAEYFEKGIGMKEPVVIPAAFNPQPTLNTSTKGPHSHHAGGIHQLSALEANTNLEEWFSHDPESQRVPDEGQDGLDMVMPQGLTVRRVAELYGPEEKVEVIDVKSQNGENKKWNMRRWADYYENQNNKKIVRNVISLEVSQSKLGRLIRRPQIVRDLDLQDSVWPEELLAKGEFPRVQFYCLMSVADCFTDFHIDFGGSSVFYHILKGKKTFFFIPPKEKHLKKYEEWCMSPAQNWTFLPDQTKECYRVDLSEGDTMLIPSGWIHAVWTPEDSLVIGGNFLTRMNYGMQLRIAQVEKATGVSRKFRYPHFQKLHWYTALRYLEDDPLPANVRVLLEDGGTFHRDKPTHYDFDDWGQNSRSGPERYNARYYSQPELDGLLDLARYLLRTALIDIGSITEGISADTRNAVKKSIPRGHGEPLDVVKTFAIWCAWKRGNEPIPHWAYPEAVPETGGPDKLSAAASKKLDQEAALKAPRRQSARMQFHKESAERTATVLADGEADGLIHPPTLNGTKRPSSELNHSDQAENAILSAPKRPRVTVGPGTGSHRKTACESCRRRRRACKHKDSGEALMSNTPSINTAQDPSLMDTLLGGIALQDKLHSIGDLFGSPPTKINGTEGLNFSSGLHQVSDNPTAPQPVSSVSPSSPRIEKLAHGQDYVRGLGTVSGNQGPSRPRTKACNECRKSKRRCIHDAFGNEDPIKVAETAIPRPHARKINKIVSPTRKQPISMRTEFTSHNVQSVSQSIFAEEDEKKAAPVANMLVAPTADMVGTMAGPLNDDAVPQDLAATASITYDTYKKAPSEGQSADQSARTTVMEASVPICEPEHSIAIDPALFSNSGPVQVSVEAGHGETNLDYQQAPTSSLVSPPASSHDDLGNSPPAHEGTCTNSPSSSRQGSQQKEHFQRYTPESGTIRRTSNSSYEDGSSEREPLTIREEAGCPAQKHDRTSSAIDADDESLRLIKELQAQDLGLRRRGRS